ncbi:MAG: transcriptional repressor [Clostridiales bacterium]|nr:transcriptional repressor [Clostridiales bacterium]
MNDVYTSILQKVKIKGYKLTPQRKAVIDTILKNDHRHLNTEEIYEIVKELYPNIGLATVYRTLIVLDELDVITKMNFDDGCIRYEMNSETHQHHHLICRNCGNVIEVMEDLLDDLEKTVEKKYQFKIIDHNLKIYGLCKNCLDSQ